MATVALVVAIVGNGLLAGLFLAFAVAVCPGFRRVDDLTYVAAFRAVNAAILNGLFLSVFLVGPLAAVVAAALHLAEDGIPLSLLAGAVCAMATPVVTATVNVPLNQRLDAAPVGTEEEVRAARRAFEARWTRWNLVRTITSTAALVLLTVTAVG